MKRPVKITLRVFLILLAVFLAISLAGGAYMVNYALKPEVVYDEQAEISGLSERHPGLTEWVECLMATGHLKDTSMIIDGLEKHCYIISAVDPSCRKTAVTIHGYTSNPMHMMSTARMFRDSLGYNVIVPHLHYHGFSEGSSIQMGWKDRLDVIKWMEMAHERFRDTLQVVHGVSMGGATTMMVSGEALPSYVRGFVEDCGYTSVWEQFSKELKERFGLGDFPVLYSADLISRLCYGWGFKEASSLDQLARCVLPMLFIHGDKDGFVPYSMLEKNYNAKSQGYREMWSVPGVAHADSFRTFPAEYTARVRSFLQEHVE